MSIDSEAKRKSSTHFISPFFPQLIPPDGTIAQGDRQAAAWCYSGILAATPSVITVVRIFLTFIGKTLGLTFDEAEPGITMAGNAPGVTITGDRG
ncbi:hypothetical protein LCGC14_2883010 [marine sediment metagenome]|uniref:Uncharacterized protein n=1 Tax=marine sediment metagenome TaxID=412755 RepID=A0A0F8XZT0_9ZZZZ